MKEEPLPTETNSELLTYYHPPTKLREGDVFSRVSVCPQAGWVISHHAGPQPPSPGCTGPWPQFPFVQSTSPGPDMLNLLYYEARMVGKQTFGILMLSCLQCLYRVLCDLCLLSLPKINKQNMIKHTVIHVYTTSSKYWPRER